MGYQDRDWNRGGFPAGGGGSILSGPANRAFRLFRVFGITVSIHLIFILWIGTELLYFALRGAFWFGVELTVATWVTVLLHEFGHCFGARLVGGSADSVLLWPLGGLAYTDPPHRPGAHLVTTVCGPAVNAVLIAATAAALFGLRGDWLAVSLHPLHFLDGVGWFEPWTIGSWLAVFLGVNLCMLLFNLLPIYPLDGGRILHELLWFRKGYHRSMMIALPIGMGGAICLGIFGLLIQQWMMVAIAVMCYIASWEMHQYLSANRPEPWQDPRAGEDPPASDEPVIVPLRPKRPWFWQRWRQQREAREEEMAEEILAKISREGMDSLTGRERRILRRATERRRRDGAGD